MFCCEVNRWEERARRKRKLLLLGLCSATKAYDKIHPDNKWIGLGR